MSLPVEQKIEMAEEIIQVLQQRMNDGFYCPASVLDDEQVEFIVDVLDDFVGRF